MDRFQAKAQTKTAQLNDGTTSETSFLESDREAIKNMLTPPAPNFLFRNAG
jgi:hypothetical protein